MSLPANIPSTRCDNERRFPFGNRDYVLLGDIERFLRIDKPGEVCGNFSKWKLVILEFRRGRTVFFEY